MDSLSAIGVAIPRGKAVALPSVLISEEEEKGIQKYAGRGDKPHLGGFTDTEFDVRARHEHVHTSC